MMMECRLQGFPTDRRSVSAGHDEKADVGLTFSAMSYSAEDRNNNDDGCRLCLHDMLLLLVPVQYAVLPSV